MIALDQTAVRRKVIFLKLRFVKPLFDFFAFENRFRIHTKPLPPTFCVWMSFCRCRGPVGSEAEFASDVYFPQTNPRRKLNHHPAETDARVPNTASSLVANTRTISDTEVPLHQ